ncbi:MAG: acetate--CoA ligase family protein [Candidatus Woesearchaeota archaeon]
MVMLSQKEVFALLKRYRIPVCKSAVVTLAEIRRMKIRTPVVVKTASEEVVHKSDIGAVITGIKTTKEAVSAARLINGRIRKHYPNAKDIFLVQEEIIGKEVIIGMKRDPQFGPVIMFGLGGIFVEVLKDINFNIAPIGKKEAISMIKETKGYAVLKGARGGMKANIELLAKIIVSLSALSIREKQISEIDLNPVIVNNKKALVVDARVILGGHE